MLAGGGKMARKVAAARKAAVVIRVPVDRRGRRNLRPLFLWQRYSPPDRLGLQLVPGNENPARAAGSLGLGIKSFWDLKKP